MHVVGLTLALVLQPAAPQPAPSAAPPVSDVCLSNACSEGAKTAAWSNEVPWPPPPGTVYAGPPGSVFEKLAQQLDMPSDEILALMRAAPGADHPSMQSFLDVGPGGSLRAHLVTSDSGLQIVAISQRRADGAPGRMITPGMPIFCDAPLASDGRPCRRRP